MSQLNSVAAALFASKYYPTPINSSPTNNAINQSQSSLNTKQGDAKVDYDLTSKDRISARVLAAVPERSFHQLAVDPGQRYTQRQYTTLPAPGHIPSAQTS